LAYKLY